MPTIEDSNIIMLKLYVINLDIAGGTVNRVITNIIPTTFIRITILNAIRINKKYSKKVVLTPLLLRNVSSNK
jgi:hypothetical protein